MRFFLLAIMLLATSMAQSQVCDLTVNGRVIDKSDRTPLSFATLIVQEDKTKGAVADIHGNFSIGGLCPGEYHLEIIFVGYETKFEFIKLNQNLTIEFELGDYNELLNEIVVHGAREDKSTEVHHAVGQEKIRAEGNKNLADVLESVAGVSILKNGSGVSKPIIHGLYGNRVTILNNGLVQAGQQWGNDHAPEIDPFVADHISVVKGAGSLEYGSSALGGVVMVDPYRVSSDPHLHGKATYAFQSNGLGHTFNTQIERADSWASWRLSGTIKYMGDTRTPDYYLTNTGRREANFSAQLERRFGTKWFTTAYYSMFNTNIAILRGSHISNLTDLEDAIGREVPFFTKENFSYQINAPNQKVNHHLAKLESEYFIDENKLLRLRFGFQADNREEFDVRRGGRSEKPALSLKLISSNLDATYSWDLAPNKNLKLGVQGIFTDNTNLPETGILPLIPDYRSYNLAGFAIWQSTQDNWLFEAGGRYDHRNLEVVTITRTTPREIERFKHIFSNYGINGGVKRNFNDQLDLSLNLSLAQRSPEVNELYSYGLHQGVSGIEEGSPDLVPERSIKGILSADWNITQNLYLQGLVYYQDIANYIYLEPQDSFRLTIRGAFPVFVYTQTDATIYGTDFTLAYDANKYFAWNMVYAIVRGQDKSNNLPLIYMPADNIRAGISFRPNDGNFLKENKIGVSGQYVFEQTRYVDGQDFLPPPGAYFLLGFNASTGIKLGENHLDINFRIDNALNTTYRDYLNRLRYFADELGLNATLSLNLSF